MKHTMILTRSDVPVAEKNNNTCKCNHFLQSQYELRMRHTKQYCFGCPNENLQQSDFEHNCPICIYYT